MKIISGKMPKTQKMGINQTIPFGANNVPDELSLIRRTYQIPDEARYFWHHDKSTDLVTHTWEWFEATFE